MFLTAGYVLLTHLDSMWHFLCMHVCHRWRNLLLAQMRRLSSLLRYTAILARGGHLEVLQWAKSQGYPWDRWACAYAARGGHLEVLQWLRSQGCPWDERTCEFAAQEGHLEVLQCARSQGCPWDQWTFMLAVQEGHLEVVQWLQSQDEQSV